MTAFSKKLVCLTIAAIFASAGTGIMRETSPSQLRADEREESNSQLNKPTWQVGDSWTIVTQTDKLQGRETTPAGKAGRIAWRFRVAAIEKIGGRSCYRIEVECMAAGRLRPKTTIWCEQKSMFLRQFQTQVAVGGQYRLIQESYEPGADGYAPVMAPINALPIALPAFLPAGSKRAEKGFRYTSKPGRVGSKDVGLLSFSHKMTQQVGKPSAKSLGQIPANYSKSLEKKPVTEVRLEDYRGTVVQLWQKDSPWPVYVDNGRTQAWLVSDKTDGNSNEGGN